MKFNTENRAYISELLIADQKRGPSILVVETPTTHPSVDTSKEGVVFGEETSAYRITRINATTCRLTLLRTVSYGGDLSQNVMSKTFLKETLIRLADTQAYFLKVRELAVFSRADGEALGGVVMDRVDAQTIKAGASREIWDETRVLKEAEAKYPLIKDLLGQVVENKLISAGEAGDVGTSLQDLTKEGADVIGGAFFATLVGNTTPKAAVDKFLTRYPAMTELSAEFVWLRPFLTEVGKRLSSGSNLGTQMRAYSGAMLSTFDMGTDLNMIKVYLATGRIPYAHASIAMIGTSMTLQILLAVSQNKNKSWRDLSTDLILAVTCVKPGVDAYRASSVRSGEPEDPDKPLDAASEMMAGKAVEMFGESIPEATMQTYTLLRMLASGNLVGFKMATASILIGIFATAFSATMMAYNFDTHLKKRELNRGSTATSPTHPGGASSYSWRSSSSPLPSCFSRPWPSVC